MEVKTKLGNHKLDKVGNVIERIEMGYYGNVPYLVCHIDTSEIIEINFKDVFSITA